MPTEACGAERCRIVAWKMKRHVITNSSQTLNKSPFCGRLWHRVCGASSPNPLQKTETYAFPTAHSSGTARKQKQWACEGERWPLLFTHTAATFTQYIHFFTFCGYKYSWKRFFPLTSLHKPNPTLCSPQSHWRIEYGAVDAHEPCSRATGWLTGCQLIKALDSQRSLLPFSFTAFRKAAGRK